MQATDSNEVDSNEGVILAGGFGTRISEENMYKPKPMVAIGEKTILWHLIKHYSRHGVNDFIICCGYKAYVIKQYFMDYYVHNCDVSFDFGQDNRMTVHKNYAEPWRVTLVDTGLNTMTGGRIKRIEEYLGDDDAFMLTYGDAVSNVDIRALETFHRQHEKLATITTVNVSQRFGVLDIEDDNRISAFREKADCDGQRINAGFMMLNRKVLDYIDGDATIFEKEPLMRLAEDGQLMSYYHPGFWMCMDTQRDKMRLEELWAKGNAPWMH